MRVRRLEVRDFRNYEAATLEPAPGLTALIGRNGEGKTNLLEALAYLATLTSFRGAPSDALVRSGTDGAVVRGEVDVDVDRAGPALIEAELGVSGRERVLLNRNRLRRSRDLLGTLRVIVFMPDDLALVKGGPGERRRFLDDTLVAAAPRHDAIRTDLDKVLRQRNALLKSTMGARPERLAPDVAATLEVWDARLAELGEVLGRARAKLVARLDPAVAKAYDQVANSGAVTTLSYEAPWRAEGLAEALHRARSDDLRRGVSTVGPHRDDVVAGIDGLAARTHGSQGEQRSLALALRLAAHEVVADVSATSPVLLLDDVFSELDPMRAEALLAALPAAQTLLSTAGSLPSGAEPGLVVRVRDGALEVVR